VTKVRAAPWTIGIAAVAGLALLLQAALSSATPPLGLPLAASLPAHALCLGSGAPPADVDDPAPFPDRAHQGCCILYTAPGLDATAASDARPPGWPPPLATLLQSLAPTAIIAAIERSPIRARAPPRA
jgi:hypothetical protein